MKNTYVTLMVAALFAAVNVVCAQETAQPEKSFGGTVVGSEHITAKVTQIDTKTREITLQGPKGKHVTFTAGPQVVNFDQIKKGDNVNITYSESVTVMVSGAGAAPSKKETMDMERAAKGEKPAGSITETMDVFGVVTAIDYKERTATLKGPERSIVVKAKENMKNFDRVKVGDTVNIKYVQKLAVEVTK